PDHACAGRTRKDRAASTTLPFKLLAARRALVHRMKRIGLSPALIFCALAACASVPKAPAPPPAATKACPPPATVPAPTAPPPIPPANNLKPATWSDLPGWADDSATDAFLAFLRSCAVLKGKPEWLAVCSDAANLSSRDSGGLRRFFEASF